MNAITLIWRQVLKELKLFQMKKNKEDAAEKTEEEQLKTPESEGHEDIYILLPCRTLHRLLEKRKRQNENNRSD